MKRLLILITAIICTLHSWALQPERGYRGFIDSSNFLDLNFGFLVGSGGDSYVSTGFTTSHGYQFNNWLYIGGGTGFIYNLNWKGLKATHYNDKSRYVIPLFAEVRFDAKWEQFTPYFSTQIGVNMAERGGLGVTVYGNTSSYLEHTCLPDGTHTDTQVKSYNGNVATFTARLGFEFQLP